MLRYMICLDNAEVYLYFRFHPVLLRVSTRKTLARFLFLMAPIGLTPHRLIGRHPNEQLRYKGHTAGSWRGW